MQFASTTPNEMVRPAVFPSWVEIPHLTGPLAHADNLDGSPSMAGPRSFLDANPADTGEQPIFLAPRANPRQPLIGLAPLDAGRLTREQLPAWDERTERLPPIAGTSPPPSAIATLDPDAVQPLQAQVTLTTQPVLTDTTSSPIVPPDAIRETRTENADRRAITVAAVQPPASVATLHPDLVQQLQGPVSSTMRSRATDAVTATVLNQERGRRARLPTPRSPPRAVPRALQPDRDTEQTASVTGLPKSARPRIDAGAVARVSLRRARPERMPSAASSPAPSSLWTLPSALAPSN